MPLARQQTIGDLALRLEPPVIRVVGRKLGCLSHALQSAEAIAASGAIPAGSVANAIDAAFERAAAVRLDSGLLC